MEKHFVLTCFSLVVTRSPETKRKKEKKNLKCLESTDDPSVLVKLNLGLPDF